MPKREKDMEPTPSPENVLTAVSRAQTQLFKQLDENDGGYASFHEGYGVLKEEYEELWDEIKVKMRDRDRGAIVHEAIQVAASALEIAAIAMQPRD